MAAVAIGLVLLAVVMVGALMATRSGGGELVARGPRHTRRVPRGAGDAQQRRVREDYADDFEVYASADYDGDGPFEADLEVDILNDERVIGPGSVTVNFNAAESHGATFVSFDDYDADFDQVIFRLAGPLTDGLADLRTVEGDFTSGDFSMTDVRIVRTGWATSRSAAR